jgi:4a-hydroxytetrahydrobiopterin dehydratase
MSDLTSKRCEPCSGDTPPLTPEEISKLAEEVPGWEVTEDHKLVKTFRGGDFVSTIDFVNRVAAIAEEQDHHPDIAISYRNVTFTIWTHAIGDLSQNDFILAAKIDAEWESGG